MNDSDPPLTVRKAAVSRGCAAGGGALMREEWKHFRVVYTRVSSLSSPLEASSLLSPRLLRVHLSDWDVLQHGVSRSISGLSHQGERREESRSDIGMNLRSACEPGYPRCKAVPSVSPHVPGCHNKSNNFPLSLLQSWQHVTRAGPVPFRGQPDLWPPLDHPARGSVVLIPCFDAHCSHNCYWHICLRVFIDNSFFCRDTVRPPQKWILQQV